MSIARVNQWKRISVPLMSLSLLCLLCDAQAFGGDENFRLTRVDWIVTRDEVVISYDLEGATDETYIVSVVLLRENDKTYSFTPLLVNGNIGQGKFAGKGNEIRWSYKNDFVRDLSGNDFYFEVKVEKPGGIPWIVVGGGAAIAGIVLALTLNPPTSESGPASGTNVLPFPPPRP